MLRVPASKSSKDPKFEKGQLVRCLQDLEWGVLDGEEHTEIPEGTLGVVTGTDPFGTCGTSYEVFWQTVGKKIFMFDDQIELALTSSTSCDTVNVQEEQ